MHGERKCAWGTKYDTNLKRRLPLLHILFRFEINCLDSLFSVSDEQPTEHFKFSCTRKLTSLFAEFA